MSINRKIGQRIRKARKQANLTQNKLAEKIGTTATAVCYYEQGKRSISPDTLNKISELTGKSIAYFYGEQTNLQSNLEDQIGFLYSHLGGIRKLLDQTEKQKQKIAQDADLFRKLIDQYNAMIFIVNPNNGKIVDFNEKTPEILEYTKKEIQSFYITKLLYPQMTPSTWNKFLDEIKEKKSVTKYGQYRTKTGRIFPTESSIKYIQIDNEEYLIGITRDISKRKKNEEKLRKLKMAVEQTPTTIIITDNKGVIEYVNPSFERLTGYDKKAVIGTNAKDITTISSKDLITALKTKGQWTGEFCNKKKNGENYWIKSIISVIKNERDEVTHYLAVNEDITRQKKSQEALKSRKNQLMHILSASPAITFICGVSKNFPTLFISKNVEDILGHSTGNFLNDPVFCFKNAHPDDRNKLKKEFESIFEKEHIHYEYRIKNSNGEYRWLHDEVKLIRDNEGKPVEIIGSSIDITNQKK